jgi:hypothetical protein
MWDKHQLRASSQTEVKKRPVVLMMGSRVQWASSQGLGSNPAKKTETLESVTIPRVVLVSAGGVKISSTSTFHVDTAQVTQGNHLRTASYIPASRSEGKIRSRANNYSISVAPQQQSHPISYPKPEPKQTIAAPVAKSLPDISSSAIDRHKPAEKVIPASRAIMPNGVSVKTTSFSLFNPQAPPATEKILPLQKFNGIQVVFAKDLGQKKKDNDLAVEKIHDTKINDLADKRRETKVDDAAEKKCDTKMHDSAEERQDIKVVDSAVDERHDIKVVDSTEKRPESKFIACHSAPELTVIQTVLEEVVAVASIAQLSDVTLKSVADVTPVPEHASKKVKTRQIHRILRKGVHLFKPSTSASSLRVDSTKTLSDEKTSISDKDSRSDVRSSKMFQRWQGTFNDENGSRGDVRSSKMLGRRQLTACDYHSRQSMRLKSPDILDWSFLLQW